MRTRLLAATLTAIIAACSDAPRLAPPPDLEPELLAAEPETFASGTVRWGSQGQEHFDWQLEEILGFANAMTLTATTDAKISVRSVSAETDGDPLWLAGIVFADGAPPIVFGGADQAVTSVLLIGAGGEELAVELVELESRGWHLTMHEVPVAWTTDEVAIEAIALRDGEILAREPVAGLS